MSNFHITYSNPWLLLLLIPAVLLTLVPYFRMNKRYRCTRNRIISMTLHLAVMALAVLVLSGIRFNYDVPNTSNEIILLVDMSESIRNEDYQKQRDDYVETILKESRGEFNVGVVTFGFNQVYAAKLSSDIGGHYEAYRNAQKPDTTATDLAAALTYAKGLFSENGSSKIVLISDGIETDESVDKVIRSVVADGVRVDAIFTGEKTSALPGKDGSVYLPDREIQIIGAAMPDYNITVGDEFSIALSLKSSIPGAGTVTLYDNDTEVSKTAVSLMGNGLQSVSIPHKFDIPGEHRLCFRVQAEGDTVADNNVYYSYLYLESFDRVLIIERREGESRYFIPLISKESGGDFDVSTVCVSDGENMPATLEQLRQYDQVVLFNIANADMPDGFVENVLHPYVYELGGGLFTVGGNRDDGSPNTYVRTDMYNTKYQEMLPVQAVDYTPPLGVMIIIDRSGSMGVGDASTGKNKLEAAKDACMQALMALTERDWIGIMTLEDTYTEEVSMMPMTRMAEVRAVIDEIESGGGTVYTGAIMGAGEALSTLNVVENKHIILITDGEPADSEEEYCQAIREYHDKGMTVSIVGIGVPGGNVAAMEHAAELGGGRFMNVQNADKLNDELRDYFMQDDIKEVNYKDFVPEIRDHTSCVNGLAAEEWAVLKGFYGTKLKTNAYMPLTGEYVPIYAHWRYGRGTVGSFMCDLSGEWSADFINLVDPANPSTAAQFTTQRFFRQVIYSLMPTVSVRQSTIDAEITEDNYINRLSVFTALENGQSLSISIEDAFTMDGNVFEDMTVQAGDETGMSRIAFLVKEPGIHRVTVEKKDAAGNVIAEYTAYKIFSYSEEYDLFVHPDTGKDLLRNVTDLADGNLITDAEQSGKVFESFVRILKKSYDPRFVFMILAIVLFLLDIAVRKFKFKWPHEIARERKERKEKARAKAQA